MSRKRLRVSIYVGAAMLAVGGGAIAAMAATAPSTKAAGGLTATFAKDSDWGTGYQARYVIKNTGGSAVTGWKLAFGLPATAKLGSFWDASVTTSGATSTAENRGYNATIPAGATAEFGFIVAGGGDPTSCTINGASCSGGGSAPTTAPTKPTTAPTTAPPSAPTKPAEPTKPPATTTPPPSNGGGGKNVRVAPYVDMGLLSNGSTTLAQLATSGNVKSYSLAFVTGAGCKASWFGAFDPRSGKFRDQIDALRAAGGDVKVSFGGATGVELAQACTDVKALQAEYQAVVSAYDLKYIDLDIEGAASSDAASIDRRSTALAALQKANPGLKISLTLPVLPEGLTNDGLNVVRSAKNAGVDLDLVNIMAMDYGRAAQDYGDLAIQAVKSTKDQLKSVLGIGDAAAFAKVGVTPMLGKNDDNGTFSQSDARDLVAAANRDKIGFVSFWEVNRDRNACNGALFQCTNVPQTPFEFSKIFAGFTG
ncbi:cellulose binding domain-containing protein [Couchioplanes caeruleus]|uniref:Cellulose-binding protein n=2 Tax=Couchioplanes caeruleus TaxID=56438 RepID=A0A1K0GG44_9ACTN|nr:cellulose binding domain-containing protein [Couchioplanes caeruleus]OJF09820.1 cellulose-binding protein [Couchioplanes caeruleus subsp. caeruleus]ROP31399.1 glycosyl hydrolase family 18 (putative chitinase) [Couchioplanes caeruleus]